jgi:uncharacterized protein with GYD domain
MDTQTPASFSFCEFLVSLGSSAMVHLGEVPDPGTGAKATNLELARHTIELLTVLKAKTVGNLDEDETKLLDALLADLQLKFAAIPSH